MNFKLFLATIILSVSCFVAPIALTGCLKPSQQRATVNTLFTLGHTVDAAYRGYLDEVVAGRVATNAVPDVSRAYLLFQTAYNGAVTVSAMNTNAPPSVEVQNAASQALLAIKSAQGK